jgi:hypothetical protein
MPAAAAVARRAPTKGCDDHERGNKEEPVRRGRDGNVDEKEEARRTRHDEHTKEYVFSLIGSAARPVTGPPGDSVSALSCRPPRVRRTNRHGTGAAASDPVEGGWGWQRGVDDAHGGE